MSRPVSVAARRRTDRMRMAGFACALLACVLLPFALWGGALDAAAPAWLHAHHARAWFVALGIGLLVADVALPVPSSVVSMALCWELGPVAGGAAVAAGSLLAFAVGYGLGRLVPEARLRRWIGAALWDRTRLRAGRGGLWWIMAARPLPLLAELSAVLAGVWRVPPWPALAHAAIASAATGALYAGSAWLGRQAPGIAATAAVLVALPAAVWIAHRIGVRRLLQESPSQPSLSQASQSPGAPSHDMDPVARAAPDHASQASAFRGRGDQGAGG